VVWTSMGAQLIKHINWDDLTTSGWKHPFPKQSNFKTFEEIWRFILLIRSLFRRWAGRQNLKVVVWDAQEKVGCGKRAWPIRGMYGIINRGGRNFSIIKTDTSSVSPELLHHFLAPSSWENLHPLHIHVFIGCKLILCQLANWVHGCNCLA